MFARIVPVLLLITAASLFAANDAKPEGDPVLEPPTLHSLGVYWIIHGDDNANARVDVEYRKSGDAEWKKGPPLFRVTKERHKNDKGKSLLNVPADAWLFAGSVLLLTPDTAYELKLSLADSDGGAVEKTLKAKTIAEPVTPAGMNTRYVVPGTGGGTGTEGDPYKGLVEAQANAKPGDLFLLQPGTYAGMFTADKSGEPGKPIIWRGAAKGEAIIDAIGADGKRSGRGISAGEIHDVWFEKLTIRNADFGLVGHRSANLVIRRCHFHQVEYGITFTNNDNGKVRGFFISDNLMEGPSTWPRTKGIESARGIQATGTGHVICYNRIRGFADAVDTFGSPNCAAIDIHNNDVSELTDDGIEADYSERNVRCFHNRLTNVFQGISTQPIFGGPIYIFRNAMYNVCAESFKMHNAPSGAIIVHNTSVKKGPPLQLYTNEKVNNFFLRNNLFIGTEGIYCYENTATMVACDFDYDGFSTGTYRDFMKWNNVRYKTLEEVKEKAPVYKHAVAIDPATAFASGIKPPADEKVQADLKTNDLRLKEDGAAIDAGVELHGFNDGFKGKAPDLGAYELGAEMPHYGPRPEK
jgi:hypothetical protein